MIADLHCHYPMHLLAEVSPQTTVDRMTRVRRRPRWLSRLRAAAVAVAARVLNYRSLFDRWRVDLPGLERADARVVLSVLYDPFAEIDLDEPYGAPPGRGYFDELVSQIELTERSLERIDPGHERHVVVRALADLDAAAADGRVAFLHCVEGGFHLGGAAGDVDRHVAELARRGVVYITLAHLFWRRVATNTPALPFLPDGVYDRLFPQPRGEGLTALGEAAVRAMYRHRVLIDVSHMRADALDETFRLLEELDRERGADPADFPVLASHAGYRFGKQQYMLAEETVRRIHARDGVVGLILARHQLEDGLSKGEGIDHTVATVRRHIDALARVTGSHRHVALGSDLDGFIKPTMSGIEQAADLGLLRAPLTAAYPDDAEAILSGNALRVVRRILAQR